MGRVIGEGVLLLFALALLLLLGSSSLAANLGLGFLAGRLLPTERFWGIRAVFGGGVAFRVYNPRGEFLIVDVHDVLRSRFAFRVYNPRGECIALVRVYNP